MNLKKTKSITFKILNKDLAFTDFQGKPVACAFFQTKKWAMNGVFPQQTFEKKPTRVKAFSTRVNPQVTLNTPVLEKSPWPFGYPFHMHLSKKYYQNILAPDIILKQNYTTIMEIPRLEKVVFNTTSKKLVFDKKLIVFTLAALELISGQKPKTTYAHNSISNFKIRQHQILGCQSVLRKNAMYNFLDKMSLMILPQFVSPFSYKLKMREPDSGLLGTKPILSEVNGQHKKENSLVFCRFKRKHRRRAAYNIGIQNPMIFPELEKNYDLIEGFQGMNCTFVLSHSHQKASFLLLSGFQIPLNWR